MHTHTRTSRSRVDVQMTPELLQYIWVTLYIETQYRMPIIDDALIDAHVYLALLGLSEGGFGSGHVGLLGFVTDVVAKAILVIAICAGSDGYAAHLPSTIYSHLRNLPMSVVKSLCTFGLAQIPSQGCESTP